MIRQVPFPANPADSCFCSGSAMDRKRPRMGRLGNYLRTHAVEFWLMQVILAPVALLLVLSLCMGAVALLTTALSGML